MDQRRFFDAFSDFTHGNDSRVTAKNDLLDDKWNRSMKYDFAGRLTFAQFGMGIGTNNQNKRVYKESIQYENSISDWGLGVLDLRLAQGIEVRSPGKQLIR